MICERNGMEKVFDLTERCVPHNIDLSVPTIQEYARYLCDTTRRAHAVFTWKQLLHLKTGKPLREAMQAVLDEYLDAKILQEVKMTGLPTLYVDRHTLENAESESSKDIKTLKILSPFDNALIHRDRLSALFNFDYRMECYVPAPKRQFGYFCLPMMYGDQFVGRVDCKAHRFEQRFEVLSFHLEKPYFENQHIDHQHFTSAFKTEIQKFADFNQCPQLDDRIWQIVC